MATVLRVVDGDTIEVDIDGAVERLRYIGIDTPETDERCAQAATAANEAVLGEGIVRLVPDEENRDTYGRLLRYVYVGETFVNLELAERGVAVVDASAAGLGGCPYAKGASGNVASEDVLYMLNGLGVETGVDLDTLARAGWLACEALGRTPASKVSLALKSKAE